MKIEPPFHDYSSPVDVVWKSNHAMPAGAISSAGEMARSLAQGFTLSPNEVRSALNSVTQCVRTAVGLVRNDGSSSPQSIGNREAARACHRCFAMQLPDQFDDFTEKKK
jgi:hypothetical protein